VSGLSVTPGPGNDDGPGLGELMYLDRHNVACPAATPYLSKWDILRTDGGPGAHIKMVYGCVIAAPTPAPTPAPPTPAPMQVVTGQVVNSQNAQGEEGVTVTIIAGDTERSKVTNATGHFIIEAPAGNATISYFKEAFINESNNLTISSTERTDVHGTVSPAMPPDDWRIILQWGEFPKDLDSYTTFGACDIKFSKKSGTCFEGLTANLDVDSRHGFGPETTTLSGASKCQKRGDCKAVFKVKQFSGDRNLSTSGATVFLKNGNHSVQTFNVNGGPENGIIVGRWWYVFYLYPRTGEVHPCTSTSDCP